MLDLPFSNECFDVVIEKGTMVNMKFVMFFLLDVLEFLYDALNSHNYKLSTTQSITFDFEGCIVRGQWRPMESAARNSK